MRKQLPIAVGQLSFTSDTGFATQYIENIPWSHHPLFAFSKSAEEYKSAFEKVLENIPLPGTKIDFKSDVWDFNPYYFGVTDPCLVINYIGFDEEEKIYTKFYTLFSIMGKKKVSTTHLRVCDIKTVLTSIKLKKPHSTLRTITTNDICDVIGGSSCSQTTIHNRYESVFQFYSFIQNNYHIEYPVNLSIIKKKGIEAKGLSKTLSEKLPNIPPDYFRAIVKKSSEVMRDDNADYNHRITAAEIVILSQTGFRIADCLALTTDRLKEITLKDSNLTVNFIHYSSRKPSKPHDKLLEFDIVSNSLCTEAFKMLCKLRKKHPACKKTDFLYLPFYRNEENSKKQLPVPRHFFGYRMKEFFMKYLPEECMREWEGIAPCVPPGNPNSRKIKEIYVPDTRQFRVAVCTEFYNRGVPLVYIQRYMGHLSEYMLGYYVRPTDHSYENAKFSEKIINSIVKDDETPIGFMGEELKNRMKAFLESGNVHVEDGISGILEALGDNVIIRAKEGGNCACIRTSFMPCAFDARSNEALCAYGECRNIYLFYFYADITYNDFMNAVMTYQHNDSIGKRLESQKELMKIKSIVNRRLLPELDELEKAIKQKGVEKIITQYPTMAAIIPQIEIIRKEANIWMNK